MFRALFISELISNRYIMSHSLHLALLLSFSLFSKKMPITTSDEFVTTLAALTLYDGEVDVSSENIAALVEASGNKVEPYWPTLFAGFLKDGMIEKIVLSGGAGGGGGGGSGDAGATDAGGDAGEAKKEEKPKEEEVDALAGGMDMFGGGSDY